MSFQPLKEGTISSALFGAADPSKFVDVSRDDVSKNMYKRHIHGSSEKKVNIGYTLIIIVISAIIFVTAVSIYDVFRSLITNYFAEMSLKDPNAQNKKEEIERTIIANKDSLKANFWFSLFCIFTGSILIYILIKFI
jgi:hypothetical protein